jgi:NAD(P)-dependent dehydrogenase (short-subunit alcohol dehydrogenase family)
VQPLTPDSTVEEWLDHPAGGPLLRGLVEEHGQDPAVLRAVHHLPLTRLAAMSGGLMTDEALAALAAEANAAPRPAAANGAGPDGAAAPARPARPRRPAWQERITAGRFTGQTVVVTGAGSGIGRATAARVAREGGRVVAVDLAADRLAALAAEHDGLDVVPVTADITREDDVAAVLAAAGGRVDGLANVAGVTDDFTPVHETTDEVWERVLAVNLTGTFRLTRAVLPAMLRAGRGAVVNVASEAALRGSAAGTAYTTSKHAVVGLTRSAAFMYADRGIRVNAVAPGPVATGIAGAPRPPSVRHRMDPLLATIPELAEPEHLAASITFLLSDDAVNVTGVVLPSDGGWSVQ